MAFLQLEDSSSTAEIILFPKTYKRVEQWLSASYQVFIVKGALDLTALPKCKIKADECIPIEMVLAQWPNIKKASYTLPVLFQEAMLESMQQLCTPGSIPLEFMFQEHGTALRLTANKKIALDSDIIQALEKLGIQVGIQL